MAVGTLDVEVALAPGGVSLEELGAGPAAEGAFTLPSFPCGQEKLSRPPNLVRGSALRRPGRVTRGALLSTWMRAVLAPWFLPAQE